jgi:ATP-dependent RNA helicase DDX27
MSVRAQAARLDALERFRVGAACTLLATDVAARGLDVPGVEAVVSFDCPPTVETYLHRIGRTARAGAGGRAVTFVEDGDRALVKAVVKRVRAPLARRAVPPAAVEKWRRVLEELQPQVDAVLAVRRGVPGLL